MYQYFCIEVGPELSRPKLELTPLYAGEGRFTMILRFSNFSNTASRWSTTLVSCDPYSRPLTPLVDVGACMCCYFNLKFFLEHC